MYRKIKNVTPKTGNYIYLSDDVPIRANDLVRYTYYTNYSDYADHDIHQYYNWATMSEMLPVWIGHNLKSLRVRGWELEAIRPLDIDTTIDDDLEHSPLVESYIADKDFDQVSKNVHTCAKCGVENLRWKLNHNRRWWLIDSTGAWHTCADPIQQLNDKKAKAASSTSNHSTGKYNDHLFYRDEHDIDRSIYQGVYDDDY